MDKLNWLGLAAKERRPFVNALGLHPYDPALNKPQDVGLGGTSTEYLNTGSMYGGVTNYPQIWWDEQGNPILLTPEQAWLMSKDYQDATGVRFPQFDNVKVAEWAAKSRSAQGGAEKNALATYLSDYTRDK